MASEVDARTLESLDHVGIDTTGLRSKAIDEFEGQRFHYVITLCDKSSEEASRMPSAGEVIVWNFEDPVTSENMIRSVMPFRRSMIASKCSSL